MRVLIISAAMFLLGAGPPQATAQTPVVNNMITCFDGQDNDGDGRADYADPDCKRIGDPAGESVPNPPQACEDGKDNDGDGRKDYPDDDGCSSFTDTDEGDGSSDRKRAEALIPRLTRYGAPLVRTPVRGRLYTFRVHCARVPCSITLTAEAEVTRNGRNQRVRSLDAKPSDPIAVKEPTKKFAVWFDRTDFHAGRLARSIKRYAAVRLKTSATLTDATGATVTAQRTITLRAKPKPRPVPKPKRMTVTDRAEAAVARELERAHDVRYPDVQCQQMTSTYFVCPWEGLSDLDVTKGNTSGWKGTARVDRYGDRFDVRLGVDTFGN